MAPPEDDEFEKVAKDEDVYRMVRHGRGYYTVDVSSQRVVTVSPEAFADPAFQPSVDRVGFRRGDPAATQRAPENAVVQLPVAKIRDLGPIEERSAKDEVVFRHDVDVKPDPVPEKDGQPANPAHALVVVRPDYRKPRPSSEFRKLKVALARLAEETGSWPVLPLELRQGAGRG